MVMTSYKRAINSLSISRCAFMKTQKVITNNFFLYAHNRHQLIIFFYEFLILSICFCRCRSIDIVSEGDVIDNWHIPHDHYENIRFLSLKGFFWCLLVDEKIFINKINKPWVTKNSRVVNIFLYSDDDDVVEIFFFSLNLLWLIRAEKHEKTM